MSDPFREQKIQNWAAEFSDLDELAAYPAGVRDCVREIAGAFLSAACRRRDVEPAELTENDLKAGLRNGPAKLALPAQAQGSVVELCALFVENLQKQGRMAAGSTLAPFVRASRSSYAAQAEQSAAATTSEAPKAKPFVKPGSKLGLNDPCPCGSGLKYKKCCKRLL